MKLVFKFFSFRFGVAEISYIHQRGDTIVRSGYHCYAVCDVADSPVFFNKAEFVFTRRISFIVPSVQVIIFHPRNIIRVDKNGPADLLFYFLLAEAGKDAEFRIGLEYCCVGRYDYGWQARVFENSLVPDLGTFFFCYVLQKGKAQFGFRDHGNANDYILGLPLAVQHLEFVFFRNCGGINPAFAVIRLHFFKLFTAGNHVYPAHDPFYLFSGITDELLKGPVA